MENQHLRLKGGPSGLPSYVTSPWYTAPVARPESLLSAVTELSAPRAVHAAYSRVGRGCI